MVPATAYDLLPPSRPLVALVTFNRLTYSQRAVNHLVASQLGKADIYIVDNGSTDGTADWLAAAYGEEDYLAEGLEVLLLPHNIGTARAVNKAWQWARPGQICVFMPNDVTVAEPDWLLYLAAVFEKWPDAGTVNLKWAGVVYRPDHPDPRLKTKLLGNVSLAEKSSNPSFPAHAGSCDGFPVEHTLHPFGAALAARPALLHAIGGMNQPGLYGWDDILYLARANVAGFKNVFLDGMQAEHFDSGGQEVNTANYLAFKAVQAKEGSRAIGSLCADYASGRRSIYVPFVENENA